MPPSETSAPPSYPARVVRYLSERRHALERGAVEREAYDAEVELVFERVLDDTARGCATKILTVNALREANLCDEKTAARYVTLCVGAHRRGGAPMPFREDDAIEREVEAVDALDALAHAPPACRVVGWHLERTRSLPPEALLLQRELLQGVPKAGPADAQLGPWSRNKRQAL